MSPTAISALPAVPTSFRIEKCLHCCRQPLRRSNFFEASEASIQLPLSRGLRADSCKAAGDTVIDMALVAPGGPRAHRGRPFTRCHVDASHAAERASSPLHSSGSSLRPTARQKSSRAPLGSPVRSRMMPRKTSARAARSLDTAGG
jgi:hypothetical protein